MAELPLAEGPDDLLTALGQHVAPGAARGDRHEGHHREGETDADEHAEDDGDHAARIAARVERTKSTPVRRPD